ncbi:MAG: Crp/Fnr family transcriptional regulator [Muribaculaceae bacterium]|uniref:Crp/Fnr family transcriptional regulator n=1 Tax=Muribaculum intestinale TaxID=1796646 RepID=UPI001A2EAB4D|nr:Crp/Fnr family transcriptional regulator [Muribaculum intestinale]MBJ2184053.1 Crp/Fnr family transcriptional regulator [Muribaculaceae bacterium]
MAENFNSYIEQIDFEAWREVCVSKGTLRHFAKGEEFVTIGKVGRYIGYIVSGALKYVACSADGTEHVMGLVFGNGFAADWPFCLYGQKAKLAIVAVSDCDIYCIPTNDFNRLIDTDPTFKDIVMHSTEAVYSTVYDRYVDLYVKTPQQRYHELVTNHPDLFDIFSLKDIASFLNITPTHLSRLRKNDSKQC